MTRLSPFMVRSIRLPRLRSHFSGAKSDSRGRGRCESVVGEGGFVRGVGEHVRLEQRRGQHPAERAQPGRDQHGVMEAGREQAGVGVRVPT